MSQANGVSRDAEDTPECEGNCRNHGGMVHRVHVTGGPYIPRDWGEYWYCETAITEDRARGFDVEVIDE